MMVARTQSEHEAINAMEYPGTRQLCVCCDRPTGRCEEDAIFLPIMEPNGNDLGPLCGECCDCYQEWWTDVKYGHTADRRELPAA